MNLIVADFDWISLVFIVASIIGGVIKANSKNNKKTLSSPTLEEIPTQEGVEYDYIYSEEEKQPTPTNQISENHTTISSSQKKESQKTSTEEENEEYISPIYNIRQAIISSEILKRPDY